MQIARDLRPGRDAGGRMDLNDIPIFGALQKRMTWLNRRQRVLAQNIANADTPGYKPRDLQDMSFKDLLRKGQPSPGVRTTQPGHIAVEARGSGSIKERDDEVDQTTPTGNAVNLEEQMMKSALNQADYELTLNLYRKQIGMLRTALGRK